MKFPIINKNSYTPAYIQVKNHFLQLIETQELQPGDQIPPENDIVHASGLSRMTIRQGIQQLVQSGYLKAQRGLGTFVTTPVKEPDTMLFCPLSKNPVYQNKKIDTKIITLTEKNADPIIAEKLEIVNNTPIWYCERVRFVDSKPITYEISYIAKDKFREILTEQDLKISKYEWINKNCKNNISFAKQELIPTIAGKKILEYFTDITAKTPIIKMDLIARFDSREIFECSTVYYHPKNFQLSTTQQFKG